MVVEMLTFIQMTEHCKVKTSSLQCYKIDRSNKKPSANSVQDFFFPLGCLAEGYRKYKRKYLVNYIVNNVLQHFSGLYRS